MDIYQMFGAVIAAVVLLTIWRTFSAIRPLGGKSTQSRSTGPIVIVTYRGSQEETSALFQRDAMKFAAKGYFPTTQSWSPGQWGTGAFVVALLLCFVLIGFLVFIYMLVVKPEGTLTVTYQLREAPAARERELGIEHATKIDEKICPKCAERIKAAALVCHFCGYEFSDK